MNKKLQVGIIFGGKSGEHEVSIQSAKSVISSLDSDKYQVHPIVISKSGHWFWGATANLALELGQADADHLRFITSNPIDSNHDVKTQSLKMINQNDAIEPTQLSENLDVVIPLLHGSYGEDGSIQGMLELLDIPYVGAGILASAVGLDKVFMKTIFAAAGLPQVKFTSYTRNKWSVSPDIVVEEIETNIGYPCFVKPANLGSSVGISKVKNRDQLKNAMDLAAKYDRKLIVEEGLDVREIEIAVLGNECPEASVPGEVQSSNEFYDYEAKYLTGESMLIIPAPVTEEQTEEIKKLAIQAFQAVDCSGLARVDFFIEKTTNKILINEINTMPGFTEYSMYPKLWEATGLSYSTLIDRLLQYAMERHSEKLRTSTDYHL